MNKDIEIIFNKAKEETLTKEEKALVFSRVSSYMENNPIPHVSPYVTSKSLGRLYYKHFDVSKLTILTKNTMIIPLLILLALAGGSTSVAANNSLPGDILYPVKVHVNEGVESLLALTDKTDAQVSAKHAILRLKEAEQLATQGVLTPELTAEVKNYFADDLSVLVTNLENLKKSGDASSTEIISDSFENQLNTRRHSLKNLAEIATSSKVTVLDLQETVSVNHDRVKSDLKNREQILVASSTSPESKNAAEGALLAATNKVEEVKKFVTTNKVSRSIDTSTKILGLLSQADENIASGKKKIEDGDYSTAFTTLKDASRVAQDAKLTAIFESGKMKAGDDEDDFDEEENEDDEDEYRSYVSLDTATTTATSTLATSTVKLKNPPSNKGLDDDDGEEDEDDGEDWSYDEDEDDN